MARREPRVTAKSIIEHGLLSGVPDDQILAEVKAKLPDSQADGSHLNYYRSRLAKGGLMRRVAGEALDQAKPAAMVEDDGLKYTSLVHPKTGMLAIWIKPAYMGELEQVEVGGVRWAIYGDSIKMLDQVRNAYWPGIIKSYQALTGDLRSAVSVVKARAVIMCALQEARCKALELPPEMLDRAVKITAHTRQEALMAKAEATETTAAAAKEPRVTVKSIITQGLIAGTEPKTILGEVKKHFPNGKADDTHIAYYRSKLYKTGELAKPVKEPKPAREAATPKAAAATPAAASAKAVAAPAKAVPAKGKGK